MAEPLARVAMLGIFMLEANRLRRKRSRTPAYRARQSGTGDRARESREEAGDQEKVGFHPRGLPLKALVIARGNPQEGNDTVVIYAGGQVAGYLKNPVSGDRAVIFGDIRQAWADSLEIERIIASERLATPKAEQRSR